MAEFECDVPRQYQGDCPFKDGSLCILDGLPCEFSDDDFDEME